MVPPSPRVYQPEEQPMSVSIIATLHCSCHCLSTKQPLIVKPSLMSLKQEKSMQDRAMLSHVDKRKQYHLKRVH